MHIRRLLLLTLAAWALLAPVAMAQPANPAPSDPPARRAPQPPDEPTYAPGRVLVKFEEGMALATAGDVRAQLDATIAWRSRATGAELWQVPEGQETAVIAALRANPGVAYAHPDWIVYALDTIPHDEYYATFQWNLPLIGLPAAWDITTGLAPASEVTVAVLDTGVMLTHEDLDSKLVPGRDIVNGDSDPSDDHGHGTHVAGIAAAATDNGIGVAGVSWGARIMPVKVLDASGSGNLSDVVAGIEWAVDNGADVINMSLGAVYDPTHPENYAALQDALDYAYNHGVVSVAAMGNCYPDSSPPCDPTTPMAPAALDHVIAVAATGPTDVRAVYSMVGPHCDLAAPGGDVYLRNNTADQIYSTWPWLWAGDRYRFLEGTSMATPHVAGAAALALSLDPTLSPDMVRVLLQSSAVDKGAPGPDPYYGHGRIDAYAALRKTDLLLDRNDPRADEQWALAIAGVPEAWAMEDGLAVTTTIPVTVAILSTGVDSAHLELVGRLLPAHDARPGQNNPTDLIGRGTALAGIVAADTDNAEGIAGMARTDSVRILPVRVTADSGAMLADALAAGIAYAASQGAQMMLIGGSIAYDTNVESALANARAQGALIIAGTGDTGDSTVAYPASSPHVLAVSSTTWDDALAPDACYGPGVALAAPGGTTAGETSGVLALSKDGGYDTRASTAVAAAHAAGAAAMMLSHQPAARPSMLLTARRLETLLQAGAVDLGDPGHDGLYGAGRLDVERSLWLATQLAPRLHLPFVARNH